MATATTLPESPELPDQQPDPDVQGDGAPQLQDYGEWNEKLPQELQDLLVKIARDQCDEFRYARRLEVMQDWRARSFFREMQHLSWNWEANSWDVLGPAGAEGNTEAKRGDSAVLYTTNMYQGFGDSFIAIITQSIPALRFEPEDAEDPADLQTADKADSLRKYIEHENDPIKLMTKAAYYGWCGGRIHGWTRWEMNKRTNQPQETQSVYGSMEVKVPVIYEEVCEYPYLQYSTEYHLSTVRQKVKGRGFAEADYWKKIKGGSTGNGQDTYERTARISIKQGVSLKSAGGDAYQHLVTTQRTWMRPSVFLGDNVEDQYRVQLDAVFPNGVYLEVDNGVYTGSRDAKVDDEWTVENIMQGDGSFRNGKGTCLVSVQERANDMINTTQDSYEKTQPASHWDDKMFDIDGMRRQKSMPGAKYGVDMSEMQVGDTLAAHVFFETPATVSPDQLQYLKELMTEIPEFLTGISPILFGSDSGGDKSGKALAIQQAAAMGRIGLPFRVLKRFYAGMMEQAVRCAARNRKADMVMGVPDDNGKIETISIRIEDLHGNVRCFADEDEAYPETWTQKRAILLQLMQDQDPVIHAILSAPENMRLVKRLIGLDELTIPEEASWEKQMTEINYMLKEVPQPPQPQPPQQVPNPLVPHVMETIQPPPNPPQSSLPIDLIMDNHPAEGLTVTIWCNSTKGQEIKKTNPVGFMNVRLHGIAHLKAADRAQAAMAPPPMPPPGAHPPAGPHPPAGGPPKPPAAPPAGV